MADGIVEFILRLKDEASEGMDRATDGAEELAEAQKGAAEATKISGAQLLGFATAAVGAAASVAALVQSVVDARNALLDASTRTGVAAETLNGLKLAAEGSGLGFQNVEGALAGYTARLAAVSRGSKEAAQGFSNLGVDVMDANGALRDSDTILRETLTAIQAIESPTQRATAATLAFGEQGTKLLQALGGGELEDFVEVANRYGIKVGPQAAKASGDWQRSMAALQLAFDGAKASIVESFGGITGMTEGMLLLGEALIAGAALFGIWKDGLIALLLPIRTLVGGFISLSGAMLSAMSGDFQAAIDIGKGGLQDIADNAVAAAETLIDLPSRLNDVREGFGDFSADMRGMMGAAGAAPGGGGGAPAPDVTVVDDKAEKEKIDEVAKALDELSAGAFDLLFPIESGLRSLEAAFLGLARRLGQQIGGILSGNISGALRTGVEAAGRGIGSMVGGVGGAAVGGVVGAGIGAAIQGLGTLGSEGAGAMVGKISKTINDISAGIEELPDFIVRLAERLPDLLMNLVTSILVNLPKILTALLIKLPVHFAQGLIDWWRMVWAEIKAWFRDLFTIGSSGNGVTSERERSQAERVAAATGQGAPDLAATFQGSRDIGGLIPQTGLYLMHSGETVIRGREQGPNTGTSAAAGRSAGVGMGGSGMTVNVYTPVADSNFADYIVREFERMFGAGGLRSSSVFGG